MHPVEEENLEIIGARVHNLKNMDNPKICPKIL